MSQAPSTVKPSYHWEHIPTGRQGVSEFTRAQDPVFANPHYVAASTVLYIQQQLISKWNLQQPNNWLYWL